MENGGATLSVGTWQRKNKNKLVESKVLVVTVEIKCANFKKIFFFPGLLRLSMLLLMEGKALARKMIQGD